MALPFLPPGASSLPAQRTIVFADSANRVNAIDESLKTEAGETFFGFWLSPSLNRADQAWQWTLKEVHLEYTAEADTSLRILFTGDGGLTFPVVRDVPIIGGDTLRKVSVYGNVTGPDLRYAIEMREDTLIKVMSWLAKMIRRGEVTGA